MKKLMCVAIDGLGIESTCDFFNFLKEETDIVLCKRMKKVVYKGKNNNGSKSERSKPMLPKEISRDLITGLRGIFTNDLISIILYGSVARKEDTNESDVDIAMIINKPISQEQRTAFIELISDLDLRYDKVFSVIDIEADNYEKWGEIMPFYKNIKDDGVILWNAA